MTRSKQTTLVALVLGIVGMAVVASPAAATYDHPKDADGLTTSFVTAYNECTAPTMVHREGLALPACVPVETTTNDPTNVMSFGKKGKATMWISAKSGNYQLSFSAKDILNNGVPYTGGPPIDDGFTILVGMRQTDDRCYTLAPPTLSDQDCTINYSTFMWYPIHVFCRNGSCSAMGINSLSVLPFSIRRGDLTNIELTQIALVDPDGDVFARQGAYLRRKSGPAAKGFAHPDRAVSVDTSFASAFDECTAPTLAHIGPTGPLGCTPVASSSASGTTMSFSHRTTTSLSTDYANVLLKSRSQDLLLAFQSRDIYVDGAPASSLTVSAPLRVTDAGCGVDPPETACTMVDFPLALTVPCTITAGVANSCSRGGASTKTLLPGLKVLDGPNVEVGQFAVQDAEGEDFARQGIFIK